MTDAEREQMIRTSEPSENERFLLGLLDQARGERTRTLREGAALGWARGFDDASGWVGASSVEVVDHQVRPRNNPYRSRKSYQEAG